MAINSFKMVKLSAFTDATFEFVPGINVLLGANSVGKTHVLKWIYATLKVFERPLGAGDDAKATLKQKLSAVFLPDERRVGRLVQRRQGVTRGELELSGDEGTIAYHLNSKDVLTIRKVEWTATAPALFLPSREVLALYEGFVNAYENRVLSLDETYYDACVALNGRGLRGIRGQLAQSLMDSIEHALAGKVELIGDRFYVTFSTVGNPRLEAHLVAEGLRKIGSLARLVQNGSLLRGGTLIWDEPEASLNPRLITAIVRILAQLASEGVQIILATHDYLLAKRMSMIAEADGTADVRLFLLSRSDMNAPVEIAAGRTMADLPQTPMEEEFLRLYEDEGAAFAGGIE